MARRSPLFFLAASITLAAACGSHPTGGTGGSGGTAGSQASSSSSHASVASTGSLGTGGSGGMSDHFTVTGVVTDGANPVEGATVMQGGGDPAFVTGADGKFSIDLTTTIPGTPTVVAAKIGYRTAGIEFLKPDSDPVTLTLLAILPPDNITYTFGDPGNGNASHDSNTSYCGHCHTTLVKEWVGSAHARAARDPLVQDLYAGVTEAATSAASCAAAGGQWRSGILPGDGSSVMKCYLGGGVLPDLNPSCGGASGPACDDPALPSAQQPTAFGRCADCHAPGIDGALGGRSLHEAFGIAYENGNHCDVCHHAADVDLTRPPGVAGALVIHRPHEKTGPDPGAAIVQAMYGPRPDVPNGFMGGSWQPKFLSADLCGACHEQKQEALVPGTSLDASRWPGGLPTHSTYSEWAASPYNTPGTPCQQCHMPPDDTGLANSVDSTHAVGAGITAGFARTPGSIRKHLFRDPLQGNPRLIDSSVVVDLYATTAGSDLAVTVKLKNLTAGHAIPTGEPMRSLLLVVRASACGTPMAPSGGMTLDDWGGALAEGTVGAGVKLAGGALDWAGAGALAKVGSVVRAVRPTGVYDDYGGIGFFADPALSPMEKGLEVRTPIGEATVTAVTGDTLTLSAPLALQMGDMVFLGEAQAWPPVDGAVSAALAGGAGYSFARTLADAAGNRGAPHYRAVDMLSDNRIAPGKTATTQHAFAIPGGCTSAQVEAAVIYRPIPVGMARERGWDARDYVIATTAHTVALP